jgi:hypothetical protein
VLKYVCDRRSFSFFCIFFCMLLAIYSFHHVITDLCVKICLWQDVPQFLLLFFCLYALSFHHVITDFVLKVTCDTTRLTAASDQVYQLLVHGRWFSQSTPTSSTTKTGRHDIAEILLRVALGISCFWLVDF